jgi:large subunit ribosomal protein L30
MAAKSTGAGPKAGTRDGETKTLTITLVKSPIGFNEKQGRVVQSMGLRRLRHSVRLADTPETRGMIHKVRHLVTVTGD